MLCSAFFRLHWKDDALKLKRRNKRCILFARQAFSGFIAKSVKLLMLAHTMCILKLGELACTQELLFLVPTIPLLLDSPKPCFLCAKSELYCDRFWMCIRTAMYYNNLYFQKPTHVLSMVTHNASQFSLREEPRITPFPSSKPHLS